MTEPNMDGYITITHESDGVYLTVFPPQGQGVKPTLEDVKRELAKYKVVPADEAVLASMVDKPTGTARKISSAASAAGQDQIFVEISDDEMAAKVTVVPPQSEKEHFVVIDDVREALRRKSVVFGIDENKMTELSAKLARMAADKNLSEPVEAEVAFGTHVKDGEDGRIDYLYKEKAQTLEAAQPVVEDEEGRVDYRAAHHIENIAKGTVLARKIPATKGTPGMTVTGKATEAKDGKEIEVVAGKGVVASPDAKDEWIADTDGQVIIKDNKISVLALYEVAGDVNFSTGNIDFVGTVIVRGDVKDGFKVFAGEDLVINGVVEAAELKCNGKLTIGGGVSGNDRAKIVCGGDANIKYVRNAQVEVAGDLTSAQAIMHCKVTVGRKVTVAGKKGVIVGGQVIAGQEVMAASIGSNFATPTEIIVGEALGLRAEIQKIENDLKAAQENLDKTKKGLVFLKDQQTKLGGNLPADKKELLTKLTRAQFKLMADVKNFAEKRQELEKKEQEGADERRRHAKVMCLGVIHNGVKITINKASRQIAEELKYCTLTESDGEIRVGPFKG
ncbi:MAG TPA: FapA family protein [bacterium]|nr:FapA family protein [bacterium]